MEPRQCGTSFATTFFHKVQVVCDNPERANATSSAPAGADAIVLKSLAVAALVFILLFARAMTRQPDPDEQQFVAPALLFAHSGLEPYRDYPLFHMPGLVWVYAPLVALTENALLATRGFSALVGAISATMLFAVSWSWLALAPPRTRTRFSLGIVALFIGARVFTYTNGWSWNHDAAICSLLAATLVHLRGARSGSILAHALAGMLLGVSMSIRLTTAPAALALGLCGLFLTPVRPAKRLLCACSAAAGWAVSMTPTVLLARRASDEFLFGNFGYPVLYKQYVLDRNTSQTSVVGKVGHFFQTWCTDPGNAAVLWLLALAIFRIAKSGAWRGQRGATITTLVALCAALWIGLTAPFQIQMQYHSVLLPFFLLLIVAAARPEAATELFSRRWLRPMAWACILVVGVNFPRWYWPVIFLGKPSEWTPMRTLESSRWVAGQTPPNALVLTIDPIVPLQVKLRVYPEFATGRFPFHVGPYMTGPERERHRILWGPELEAVVAQRPPDAVLYGTRLEAIATPFAEVARARGFSRHESPDGEYILWTPPVGGPP